MITLWPKNKNVAKQYIINEMKDFGRTFSSNYSIMDTCKGDPQNKNNIRLEIKDSISRDVLSNSYLWNLQEYK